MKKIYFLLSFLSAMVITTRAQSTEPMAYRMVLNKFIRYYNRSQADSVFNLFAPEVKTTMPADKNREMLGQLQTQIGGLRQATFVGMEQSVATYKANFQKSTLAMKISLNGSRQISGLLFDNYPQEGQGQAAGKAAIVDDPDVVETPLAVKTLSGTINGTIAMPKQANGKVPVVLIVPSTGPTDRDGNKIKLNQTSNSYKLLAAALAKNGVASARYDKRLVGQTLTSTKETELRFDDYIDDAVALITQLHDDPRFSKVIVLGHSEGSLVGMLAAAGQPANAFISVEGESQTADKILTEQLKSQPEFIRNNFKAIVDTLRKGKTNDKVDPTLYPIARVSAQPYLVSWMRYDPIRELKKLKIPVLIIQGTTDLQVSVADAERLKKVKSDFKLVVIPGMNYVLKEAPATTAQNIATYNQPELPVKPELVTAVVDFVKGLK
ncbi:alpha/beta hydrolase [Mucilaginibacter sp. Bleaf8]|uniref:alpha/beta fold hydrolase n=1 Tax=Mucilaginibacter sp. Bleaf8 TaxID=2834430 RepID=UPI001BCB375C|nr:alpha/beta fold hydrolase [Mucilaginibacter sp. Bleaf8]MBS7564027.1 alpha/beta hydrolase [Mucilaginibacter sp. Bleaf8]